MSRFEKSMTLFMVLNVLLFFGALLFENEALSAAWFFSYPVAFFFAVLFTLRRKR